MLQLGWGVLPRTRPAVNGCKDTESKSNLGRHARGWNRFAQSREVAREDYMESRDHGLAGEGLCARLPADTGKASENRTPALSGT
jgi:hypothetical protein